MFWYKNSRERIKTNMVSNCTKKNVEVDCKKKCQLDGRVAIDVESFALHVERVCNYWTDFVYMEWVSPAVQCFPQNQFLSTMVLSLYLSYSYAHFFFFMTRKF